MLARQAHGAFSARPALVEPARLCQRPRRHHLGPEPRAVADQLAAHIRIPASEPAYAIERLERLREAPSNREPVSMCGFNLEALARAHTVVEHCPGLFGDFEGRFRSTEHPQIARKAAESNG